VEIGRLCLPEPFHEEQRFKSPERFTADTGLDFPITKQKYIKVDTQVDGKKSTDRQSVGLRCTKNFLLYCGTFLRDPSCKKAGGVS
jgi:hypothetical protein